MTDEIEVTLNIDELVAKLHRMEANSMNLPMEAFGALALGYVDDMFKTQGASGTDGEWDPLLLSTLKRHPRRRGGMLLQDTGALANIQVTEVTEQTVVIRSPKEYSRWHLEGTEHMAKRDFFAIHFDDLIEEFSDVVMQEIRV